LIIFLTTKRKKRKVLKRSSYKSSEVEKTPAF